VIGGVLITIGKVADEVPNVVSLIVTVTSYVPVDVGVPEIFLPDDERPGGRPVIVHVEAGQFPPSHVAINV
jgi:hypothetical protein